MSEGSQIVLVTGMSGAGKSTTMHALEDAGFFCIDNLPVALLPKLTELAAVGGGQVSRMAVVMD
ncbi:MAG TPA: RNase adapter RapZ, partial [Aggregicoccus sp.]|nr:RNase adapter RapZ [Aggregicoccus sp.]